MSDDFMKSAFDRAMERADQIEVSDDKLKEMKYRSDGNQLAAAFLKDPQYDLANALSKYEPEAGKYISKALEAILLQNLILPLKESDIASNDTAFQGLLTIKENKSGIRQAQEQLKNLSNYYVQAMKQNYEQLKADVEQAMRRSQGINAETKLNVEQTPEFQEHRRKLLAHLDAQYGQALAQLKQQIASME